MKILKFGKSTNKKVMLIHGFQVPWQVWHTHIDFFRQRYQVIVPVLNGHNPSDKSIFTSIKDEAAQIEKYLLEEHGDELFAVCGMSLGGSIASSLWANSNLHIEKLLLDGAPLVPQNKILISMLIKQYATLTKKTQLRDTKTLNRCEKTFIPKQYMPYFLEMMDTMSTDTIKNCVRSAGQYKLPKHLNMENMDVLYYYGTTLNESAAKKSASYLQKHYPQAIVTCLKGYGHCELLLRHPEQHIRLIDKFWARS